ncbi:chromodomain-helicase-DNA-binding protein 7 [Nematocida minor]|uniref:chromodomain-helicase-DNA-binding protein 7 n=1 Tax=Nematocida minor TaxID=1912983 RepID=UPI002220D37F|nr:chromodomain-helicase-DNA-binding protein 7 [Nematocida minor]KAI5192907.1 chromodomain-helicase-DNA-binding protein 7 [Nematocida minor]
MHKEVDSGSDNSTDFLDTSDSSVFDSDTLEESEDLARTRKSSRGRPRKSPADSAEHKRPHCSASARMESVQDLLKGLEQEVDINLVTPLTKSDTHPHDAQVEMQEPVLGGRIMLPLSPFLNPKIHVPISPSSGDGSSNTADLQERIYNYQYINKGLASTIQYQMYLNNLVLMNKISTKPKTEAHQTHARETSERHRAQQAKRSAEVHSPTLTTEIDDEDDDYSEAPTFTSSRPRRKSAVHKSSIEDPSEDEIDEPTEEEDNVEKILSYNPAENTYYVKFRGKSYLHCDWVPTEALTETKTGEMRLRRFMKSPLTHTEDTEIFHPDLVAVERIIAEEDEVIEGTHRKIYLTKWKKFPYESSTFEYADHLSDCEGFSEAMAAFTRRRERAYFPSTPAGWRPSRDRVPESLSFFKGGRELRPYQKEGVSWLVNKWLFRQSCILADEMGLGKTVQSVAFVDTVISKCGLKRPALVVAPLSTIPHWEREFAAWTDLRVLVYHGSQAAREIMQDFEFRSTNGLLFDVILTTYEMAIAGVEHISAVSFGVCVLDEAHRLKNSRSKAAQTLRAIEVDHKVLLSGTPLQNNLAELWSLLNFIDEDKFPSLKYFLGAYKMEEAEDVERIQLLLRPLMLRRMKDDVESIPVKEETIVEVELTMIQKRFYRAILEKNMEFLGAAGSSTPNLLNIMMELRKCCIHPYLIAGAEEQILMENGQDMVQDVDRSEYYRILIQSSGKLVFLDKLLAKLYKSHKVLVFSQMTKCLDLIAEYLQYKGYLYERIDGTVRGDVRQASIDRFSTDADSFVFLLCTRAGGVGINLTAADTVIIFDSDWNPQNDLQAQARCHRIGQTAEVKIYRLVTRNTYEREMFDRASLKLGLDRAILHRDKERESAHNRKGRVESLLKKGAYGVLMEADDVNQRFCEEDIDKILEGRTSVVRHEDQSGNVFSKASFQVAEEIDDPDFWENLLIKRRAADAESRLRRVLRKMARAGLISPEEEKERVQRIEELKSEIKRESAAVNNSSKSTNGVNSTGETEGERKRGEVLEQNLSDLLVELRGTKAPGLSKAQVARSIRRALRAIPEQSIREDMSMALEWATQGDDEADDDKSIALPAGVDPLRLLFRCQVVELLETYEDSKGAAEIEWKNWAADDDALIVQQVRENGYGLYSINVDEKVRVGLLKSEKGKETAVYKGRTREELNSRLRKMLLVINKKDDTDEERESVSAAIELFGRPTQKNRESIVKMYRGRNIITEMTNMIGMIEENMKKRQSRRSGFDAELAKVLTNKINLFDRLEALSAGAVPVLRKTTGLPRGWGKEKDMLMIQSLLAEGLTKEVCDTLGVTEEVILRRAEALVRHNQAKNEQEEAPEESKTPTE